MKKAIILMMALVAVILPRPTYAISGSISGPEMIHKAKNDILTMDDIMDLFKTSGGQLIVIEDDYTGHGNQNGVYDITFSLYENPEVSKVTQVHVIDDLGDATIVTNQKEIYVANNIKLTPNNIIDILQKTGYVQINSTAAVSILDDSYTGYESSNGSYVFDFRIVTTSGTNTVYTSVIRVHEPNNLLVGDFIITGPPSLQDVVLKGFVDFLWLVGFVAAAVGIIIFVVRSRKKRGFGQ